MFMDPLPSSSKLLEHNIWTINYAFSLGLGQYSRIEHLLDFILRHIQTDIPNARNELFLVERLAAVIIHGAKSSE